MPESMYAGFEAAVQANPEQRPEHVARAIVDLVALPAGQRPMRTVVDFLGMGAAIRPYNHQLEAITHGVYGAFGMAGLLKRSSE